MLAELAAANAAFSVIKSFVSNGKELGGCVKQISDFVFAKEQIEKKAKKKKAGGGGSDLEEFMALEQIKEKEEELKKIMIYLGRPGLWQDWQAFQAEARKSRRYAEKMAEKKTRGTARVSNIFYSLSDDRRLLFFISFGLYGIQIILTNQ